MEKRSANECPFEYQLLTHKYPSCNLYWVDFVYVTLDGVYIYSNNALSRLENDFALLNLIMRESCLTRIYPYSSKSFMAFSGSLKLSVNSYSGKKELIMVYTVKLLIINILFMSLVYNNICIKLYTCLFYCVASVKNTWSLYVVDINIIVFYLF